MGDAPPKESKAKSMKRGKSASKGRKAMNPVELAAIAADLPVDEHGELRAKIEALEKTLAEESLTVARLKAENAARDLDIEAKREETEAEAELARHEARGEAAERGVELSRLGTEERLLATAVEQLRWQAERCAEIEAENADLRDQFAEVSGERTARGEAHAATMHETTKEMLQLKHQLELAFKRALVDKARHHYEKAFAALDGREKKSLLHNAQLREELSLQRTGLDAVGRRVAEEKFELAALLEDVKKLKEEESSRAVAAAKLRHSRDAIKALAKRLTTSLEALAAARDENIDASLALLPAVDELVEMGCAEEADCESSYGSSPSLHATPVLHPEQSLPGSRARTPKSGGRARSRASRVFEFQDAPRPGGFKPSTGDRAVDRGLGLISVAIAQRERHLDEADQLCRKWARRAQALRRVAHCVESHHWFWGIPWNSSKFSFRRRNELVEIPRSLGTGRFEGSS